MAFQVLEFSKVWPEIRADWDQLFADCVDPCVFYHGAFLAAVSALPTDDRPTHLVIGRDADRVVFGFPAKVRRFAGGRVFRGYALEYGGMDHLAPLDCSPNRRATGAFFESLGSLGVSVVTAGSASAEFREQASGGAGRIHPVTGRPGFCCPLLDLAQGRDAIVRSISVRLKKSLKRGQAKMEEDDVRFRIASGDVAGYSLKAALENLVLLHKDRFDSLGKTSVFTNEQSLVFHRHLCAGAAGYPGFVRFFELVQNDRVIASVYSLSTRRRLSVFQSGFEAEATRYSPIHVLNLHAIEQAIAEGKAMFDFLRGKDAYKLEWNPAMPTDYHFRVAFSGRGRIMSEVLRLQDAVARHGRRMGVFLWMRGRE